MMGLEWLKPAVFFGSVLYALIGVAVFWVCFVIVDKLTPYALVLPLGPVTRVLVRVTL